MANRISNTLVVIGLEDTSNFTKVLEATLEPWYDPALGGAGCDLRLLPNVKTPTFAFDSKWAPPLEKLLEISEERQETFVLYFQDGDDNTPEVQVTFHRAWIVSAAYVGDDGQGGYSPYHLFGESERLKFGRIGNIVVQDTLTNTTKVLNSVVTEVPNESGTDLSGI